MVMNPLKDESIDKRSPVPCIGYFRHPFAKLTKTAEQPAQRINLPVFVP